MQLFWYIILHLIYVMTILKLGFYVWHKYEPRGICLHVCVCIFRLQHCSNLRLKTLPKITGFSGAIIVHLMIHLVSRTAVSWPCNSYTYVISECALLYMYVYLLNVIKFLGCLKYFNFLHHTDNYLIGKYSIFYK